MVKKQIILFLFLILLSSNVYSETKLPYAVPDQCFTSVLRQETIDEFRLDNSLRATLINIIETKMNFNNETQLYTKDYSFVIPNIVINNQTLSIKLYFLSDLDDPEGDNFLFGEYDSFPENRIDLHISNIYYRKITDEGWTMQDFYTSVHNTLKHELTHYLDLDLNIQMVNATQTFNISIDETGNITNQQWFRDLYENPNNIAGVPTILRPTINFPRLLNDTEDWYPKTQWRNEIVARANALCMEQNPLTNFYYFRQNQTFFDYPICNFFQPYEKDVNDFNIFIDKYYNGYITNVEPQLIDFTYFRNDVSCQNYFRFTDGGNAIDKFLIAIEDGVWNIMFLLVWFGAVAYLLYSLFKYIIRKI